MTLSSELAEIVGPDNVHDDEQTCMQYAADQSFVQPRRPAAVVFAESVEQVQAVVAWANKTATPLVPWSSGLTLQGAAVPAEGGIILNLSRMNRIIEIDTDNWFAVIEPGVTVAQLQDALAQKGLRAMLPFGVPPGRSALTSCLERDPALAAASFEYGNDLLMDTEIVLPYGDLFKTGLWSAGGRPGSHMGPVRSMLYRFWSAAQGTLGFVTKACIKVELLPPRRSLHAFQFRSFYDVIQPLRAIQRKEIGLECFVVSRLNLAAMLCEQWRVPERFPATPCVSQQFSELREVLPRWVMFVNLSSGPELSDEKIAYETEALGAVSASLALRPWPLNGREQFFQNELLRPWSVLKKFCYQGAVHTLSFKSPLERVTDFQKIIVDAVSRHDYPLVDVGAFVLPVERARAVHCEFDFHCNPANSRSRSQLHCLWRNVSERLIDQGAFFDRPYGDWAEMMYSRTGAYTRKLQELKKELDPNNIMNPGKLCF